jgi:hypothetical protein
VLQQAVDDNVRQEGGPKDKFSNHSSSYKLTLAHDEFTTLFQVND